MKNMKYEEKVILAKKIVGEISLQEITVSEAKEILDISQKNVERSLVCRDAIDNFKGWTGWFQNFVIATLETFKRKFYSFFCIADANGG